MKAILTSLRRSLPDFGAALHWGQGNIFSLIVGSIYIVVWVWLIKIYQKHKQYDTDFKILSFMCAKWGIVAHLGDPNK